MKRLMMAVSALALAGGTLMSTAGASQAAEAPDAQAKAYGAQWRWQADGEYLGACDVARDGRTAYAQVYYNGWYYTVANHHGAGTCAWRDLSFPENQAILIRSGSAVDGYAVSWGGWSIVYS